MSWWEEENRKLPSSLWCTDRKRVQPRLQAELPACSGTTFKGPNCCRCSRLLVGMVAHPTSPPLGWRLLPLDFLWWGRVPSLVCGEHWISLRQHGQAEQWEAEPSSQGAQLGAPDRYTAIAWFMVLEGMVLRVPPAVWADKHATFISQMPAAPESVFSGPRMHYFFITDESSRSMFWNKTK